MKLSPTPSTPLGGREKMNSHPFRLVSFFSMWSSLVNLVILGRIGFGIAVVSLHSLLLSKRASECQSSLHLWGDGQGQDCHACCLDFARGCATEGMREAKIWVPDLLPGPAPCLGPCLSGGAQRYHLDWWHPWAGVAWSGTIPQVYTGLYSWVWLVCLMCGITLAFMF